MPDPGSGVGGSGDPPQLGQRPLNDAQTKAYIAWADANIGESIKNANAALGQLLTLSVSLLGGAIAFWNYIPLEVWLRFPVVAALLLTVLICLFAAMPSKGEFDRDDASDIKRYVTKVLSSKYWRLKSALCSLAAAIIILVGGLAYDSWSSKTPAIPASQNAKSK